MHPYIPTFPYPPTRQILPNFHPLSFMVKLKCCINDFQDSTNSASSPVEAIKHRYQVSGIHHPSSKSACSPRLAHPSPLHRSIISGRGSEATLHQAPLIFPGSTLTAETTYSYSDIASPPHSIHTVRNLCLGRVQVQERLVHPSIHPNTHSGRPRSPLPPLNP